MQVGKITRSLARIHARRPFFPIVENGRNAILHNSLY